MKVLFDHPNPFLLAHGGLQTQIEQTKAALEAEGVDVEYLRWWDEAQRGDVIHYFGRPTSTYIEQAHVKEMKVVLAELLSGPGSRSAQARAMQKLVMRTAARVLSPTLLHKLAWKSYRTADACVALTGFEAQLMVEMFDAPSSRVHVVPNGVEEVFFAQKAEARAKWLVCTATITERKRVLELAEAAVEAKTPIWIIGRPYGKDDPYAIRFERFAKQHPDVIRYEGAISDRSRMAEVYRQARGFVLLSSTESLSLSSLEAVASKCPLLLSDLPWARTVFGEYAQYCPLSNTRNTSDILRRFYDAAPTLRTDFRVMSWRDVAGQLKDLYQRLLNTSR